MKSAPALFTFQFKTFLIPKIFDPSSETILAVANVIKLFTFVIYASNIRLCRKSLPGTNVLAYFAMC